MANGSCFTSTEVSMCSRVWCCVVCRWGSRGGHGIGGEGDAARRWVAHEGPFSFLTRPETGMAIPGRVRWERCMWNVEGSSRRSSRRSRQTGLQWMGMGMGGGGARSRTSRGIPAPSRDGEACGPASLLLPGQDETQRSDGHRRRRGRRG